MVSRHFFKCVGRNFKALHNIQVTYSKYKNNVFVLRYLIYTHTRQIGRFLKYTAHSSTYVDH